MERRWLCDNKPILAKSTLNAFEEGETEAIILRDSDLEQSDVDVICENFAYATYLDLSYNKKIAYIKFLLTPTTLYLRNCLSLRDIQYRFTTCTLKNLDLAGCPLIDYEEHLSKYDFPVLENLTLSWKSNIKWRELFGKLRALKRFTIEDIGGTKSSTEQELVQTLALYANIKEITFGGIPSELDIGLLKHMKDRNLRFHIRKDVAASHLNRLCNLDNLYSVYLEHADLVTDIDLLQVITSCPNIAKITLDYCDGVTKDFIFKTAEFLSERNREQPLKARLNLEMCGCAGITEDIQQDPLYAKAESAISLVLFFKCKYPASSYRNDLIIPYPPPNVQLSIYILFEIYRKLLHGPAAQRFATVCEDFENAAIEEERHLKIIACRKAKLLNNDIYDAYLEITTEDSEFFKTLQCEHATKMELSNRIITFDTIFDDFPQLNRLQLQNCVLYEDELPNNKTYEHINELVIWGGNAFRLWQALARLLPNIGTVYLADALFENPLDAAKIAKPLNFKDFNVFANLTRMTVIGTILKDNNVEFLRRLKNLKTLAIVGNSELTGKHLSDLSSIEELQLKSCEKLSQYHLADMLSALSLKSLDIRNTPNAFAYTHLTNEMWLHCDTLKILKMDWQHEHTNTTLRMLHTLTAIELRNFQALTCLACERHEAPAFEPNNRTEHDVEHCTCLEQTQLERKFFRTLNARTHITRLTLEAELLWRNLNYLQLLQRVTHLSVIAKKTDLDIFRITPEFYRTIGQLVNLEYLYFARFHYCFDGIIHIVGRCANLKEIKLRECLGFSDVVVYDLYDVLRRRRTAAQLPLSLFMLNAKDNSCYTPNEASSSPAVDVVNRFEDVQDFIKIFFM